MAKSVTIYLIHADIRYKHAGHYCGVTKRADLLPRMEEHLNGSGNPLVRLMAEALGITTAQEVIERMIVAIWEGTRSEERRLKVNGGLGRICPVCRAARGQKPYKPQPSRQGKPPVFQRAGELSVNNTILLETGDDVVDFPDAIL